MVTEFENDICPGGPKLYHFVAGGWLWPGGEGPGAAVEGGKPFTSTS